MALQRTSVGIDIGTHAIKVVHLKVTEKGAFIQNALYFDHAALAARGVDPADRPAVAALLKTQMADQGIPTRGVALGISGDDSILRYTSVPAVPAWRLKVIMDYEVKEVAEKVGESLASDYRVLPLPREPGDDQVVLVGLAKETNLGGLLADMEAAGIHVARAMPAPIALYAAFAAFGPRADPDSPEDDITVLVDVGRTNLNSIIVVNDRIAFARSVHFGGESFTDAVAKDLGLDRERAEQLKERSGSVELEGVSSKAGEALVNALRGAAAQLQNLIQSSLKFCRTQAGVELAEPTRILVVGGGARLRGLSGYLAKAFRRPVEPFHPHGVVATGRLEGAAAEVFGSTPGDFSVPLGLAVSGVRESGFSMNILPGSYVARRRFRDRTAFLYAAGILLVLNLILGFVGAFRLNSSEDARRDELARLKGDLERMRTEMVTNEALNGQARERINRVFREVEVTAFQAFVLDFFRARLEPEIQLNRLGIRAPPDENDADFEYAMVVEGTADDANHKAVGVLDALRQALAAEERVDSADLRIEAKGTKYEFEMVIVPAFQTY